MNVEKRGKVASIVFGSIILIVIVLFIITIVWGSKLKDIIKDGFSDDEAVVELYGDISNRDA
ncbi:hypothetical protein [Bacillus sp. KH172YL63]|uniref:hypothetical protein n=1 Tax=Bacillus sp. KH172YL63 TaxID=2709784 RepID=UPI0013E419DB|nr:hypothetical protein [Bacillus sp. KH172YL63]BCB04202.1 hypothetical protein KH172YL63_23350 [Bacillus sp. KH172YL63]